MGSAVDAVTTRFPKWMGKQLSGLTDPIMDLTKGPDVPKPPAAPKAPPDALDELTRAKAERDRLKGMRGLGSSFLGANDAPPQPKSLLGG